MTWKVTPRFTSLLVCLSAWLSCGWLAAQTVTPVVGKTAKAVWEKPAGTPATATWVDVTGKPEVLKEFELVIATPLTDMNAVTAQAPPIFRSARIPYSGTNEQAVGQFLQQIAGSTGTFVAWIKVYDLAGNESLWTKSNEFGIDLASPAPASNLQIKVIVTVEVTTGGN